MVPFLRPESGDPFAYLNRTILICIHYINQAGYVWDLDVELIEDFLYFMNTNATILIRIKQSKWVFKRESFVGKEGLFGIL